MPGGAPTSRPWVRPEPGRLVGRGHPAGDFLEAWAWDVLAEDDGYLRVWPTCPTRCATRRGQLFGGFSMPVDYFEPIVGPSFIIDSRLEKQRGCTHHVLTRFLQGGELAVIAATTLREIAHESPLGDA